MALGRAPWASKLIKLADFADNTPSFVAHDPGFAPVYNAEKSMILRMMAENEGSRLTSLPLFRLAAEVAQQQPQEVGAPCTLSSATAESALDQTVRRHSCLWPYQAALNGRVRAGHRAVAHG
jgi:hypothetical protein